MRRRARYFPKCHSVARSDVEIRFSHRRMRAIQTRRCGRRDFLVSSLNAMGLKTVLPKGAFYVFPDIRSTGLSSEEFCLRLLNEHAVACVPGSAFGACGEGFIRMSYATSYEQIEVAVARTAEFVKSLRK